MEALEKKLGYTFKDKSLLQKALTHSSYVNENFLGVVNSYERLEFLGDSILGMVTAKYLYKKYPNMVEGQLSRLRAKLVCEASLAAVASKLGLGNYLRFSRGEILTGGNTRPSIIADAVEATIAAMYLDGGLAVAESFIKRNILDNEEAIIKISSDYKSVLQEITQRKKGQVITYNTVKEEGPDHNKIFTMEVCLNGERIGLGIGHSKKEGEQMAAKNAVETKFAE